MLELVVPVVVLVLVLGAITAGAVVALRRRRARDGTAETGPVPSGPGADVRSDEPHDGPQIDASRAGAGPPAADSRRRRPAPVQVQVRPLSPASRERYLTAWEGVQTRSTQRPVLALSEADAVVARILHERGLPVQEPRTSADRQALEALPPTHRQVLDSYRAGHALEQANSSSRSDPEQVAQGMVHLRQAFLGLVEDDSRPYAEGAPPPSQQRPRPGRSETGR